MAGSYKHCVRESDGLLLSPERMLLDGLSGDAWEAIEEMYWMIQYLSGEDPVRIESARQWSLAKQRTMPEYADDFGDNAED